MNTKTQTAHTLSKHYLGALRNIGTLNKPLFCIALNEDGPARSLEVVLRPEMTDEEHVAKAKAVLTAVNSHAALTETGSLLLRTVWDTLRHGLTAGQEDALQAAAAMFRDALKNADKKPLARQEGQP